MTTSKIEVQIENLSFSGEGEADWLASQLDKLLDRAEKLMAHASQSESDPQHAPADLSHNVAIAKKSLAVFLKEQKSPTHAKKFLATSAWLEAKGQDRVTTTDVSKALKNAAQTKLTNPSLAFSACVKKGHCEKDGNKFFVTQEGKDSLGLA